MEINFLESKKDN